MSKCRSVLFAVALGAVTNPFTFSAQAVEIVADGDAIEESAYVMAYYSVPELTEQSAKTLSRVIARQPGLVSAKPDLKQKVFTVVFATEKTSSKDLLAAMQTVASGATFDKEVPFDRKGNKPECEGCPSRDNCPSQRAGK